MNLDALETLRQRPPIGWLRERDIDLLLCAELHVDGALRRHFRDVWEVEGVTFGGAWVSHHDVDGESDLVVAFDAREGELVLLVENKVDAIFQREQQERYQARAERWRASDNGREVRTVLLAPSDYFARSGSEAFDLQISYEELIGALRGAGDERSQFLGEALEQGVENYRRGYTPVPDHAVSEMWLAIYKVAAKERPLLRMPKPSEKPRDAGFIHCRRPEGFSSSDRQRAEIILKKRRIGESHIDLQFNGIPYADLADAVSDLLEEDMSVVRTGKSGSVRLTAPPVDFGRSPREQLANIREWLRQAERLRRFFLDYRPLEFLDAGGS